MADAARDLARNKATIRRIYEQGFSRGDETVFEDCYAPGFRHHHKTVRGIASAAAGEKEAMRQFRAAVPDVRFTVEELIAEGDRVACRLLVTGTPVASYPPIEPTGEAIRFEASAIFRLEHGRVAEEWFYRAPEGAGDGP